MQTLYAQLNTANPEQTPNYAFSPPLGKDRDQKAALREIQGCIFWKESSFSLVLQGPKPKQVAKAAHM